MITASSHQWDHSPSIAELMEALISNSIDAIVAIDSNRKIVKFNPQAEGLLGYLESEVLGQSVSHLHEDLRKAKEIYKIIWERSRVENMYITLVHKDGSKIPVSLSASLIKDKAGRILGQVGYMRDLRQIQALQTRLHVLIETSKVVNGTLEIQQILEYLVKAAQQAIPAAEQGSIHRFDHESKKLILQICSFDYSKRAWDALQFMPEEGIAGWAFKQQEPILSPDVRKDGRYKIIDHPEVKRHLSMICAPITSKNKKFGVLSLSNCTHTEAFSQADLELLVGLADQAAIAIENADQYTEIKTEADDLTFLRDFSMNINRQSRIEDILTTILEGGNKLLHTEMAVVHWRGRKEARVRTFMAPPELEDLMTKPRLGTEEEGLTAEIFRTGKSVVVADAERDTRVNPDVLKRGIHSLVGYPLILSGQVAGVLFFNSQQQQYFRKHQMRLISWLLPLAAAAIENADFIERRERNERLLESLVNISSELARTQDFDKQMAALKQFMQEKFKAPMFYLGLYDESTEVLDIKIYCEDCVDKDLFSLLLKEQAEESISSYVLRNRSELIWYTEKQKLDECQRLKINPLKRGLDCKTCVVVPLGVEGQILGLVSIQSQEELAWDEIEVSTFRTMAHQASIAIRNARLREQLNMVGDRARRVAEKTAGEDLKTTLETVVTGVRDVLKCDIVTLWVYREEEDEFDPDPTVAGETRFLAEMSKVRTVDHSSTPFKIIKMNEPYIAEDTQQDTLLGSPFAIREHVCSSLGTPLKTEQSRVGVLFVNYCHEKHIFSDEELAIIQLFSLQAAVAIRNAMLYEEEQDRRQVLKIIDEAGRTVTGFLKLDEIFESLAKQAYELTGERGEHAIFATICLVEGEKTIAKAVYPPDEKKKITHAKLDVVDLEFGVKGKIGIIGRAVRSKAPVLVKKVEGHPDYLRSHGQTRCEMAVPIIYQDKVLGVINVEHRLEDGLDNDDLQDTQSLARHAAVAIQNARMYEALDRKSKLQQAIYDASKIINASLERTEDELLAGLVEQMVNKIAPLAGVKNTLAAIQRYDAETQKLELAARYPETAFEGHTLGEKRSLVDPVEGKIGITGRAVLTKSIQRVGDVHKDNDYVCYSEDTKSELDVPMLVGGKVLGALSLECDHVDGFDDEAERTMEALAGLAANALQNTRSYQDLRRVRTKVGNITAIAWMGLIAGGWRHSIGNMATTISDLSKLAQQDIEKGRPGLKAVERLKQIREQVDEIQKMPMPPLSSESVVEPMPICPLIRDRLNQFKAKKSYADINFTMDFHLDEMGSVRASPEWVRRIIDILIDNSKNAMSQRHLKRIHTCILETNEGVEITIADSGKGIPEDIKATLFEKAVDKKPNEKGSGIGLLLARTVVETYGGHLEIRSTSPDGTTIALWLPLLKES